MKEQEEELIYKVYIADTMFYRSQDKRLANRFLDILERDVIKETRSAEEIIQSVIQKTGIKMKGEI